MVFAIARLILMAAVVLGGLYLLIRLYARSVKREALENEWEERGRPGPRETYVADGMADYDASLTPKLLLGIFIVPLIAVGTLIYAINFW